MQEKFVIKAKTAIKRVAAMSTGALMLGATALGAVAATDLGDYPAPFVTAGQWGALVVVGSGANAADIVGATDIVGRLAQEAVSPVSGTGTTVVTGGTSAKAYFGEGIANATHNDALDYELEDDDISMLTDGQITFQSTDYDVREMIVLGQDSPIVHTSLTGSDDDYETTPYMEVARNSIQYYYLFDKAINVSTASSSQPLTIDFLGKTLKVTSVDANGNGFTAYVGDEFFLNVGDAVTVLDKTITLNNVASCSSSPCNVIVDVDGVAETVSGTEVVNGIELTVDETFYSDTTAERSASIVIGEQSSESYTDSDQYTDYCATKWASASCKKTDPDWKWVINGLEGNAVGDTNQTDGSAGPTIGIKNDFVINGDDDDPITVGGCYDLPNDFIEICFDSLTTDDYLDLTMTFESDTDLSNENASRTSEETISIKSSVEDSLQLKASAIDGLSADVKTDQIWLWINDSDSVQLHVYYEDSNNDLEGAGNVSTWGTDFLDVIYGSTKAGNVIMSAMNLTTTVYTTTFKVKDDDSKFDYGDDIVINWTTASGVITSLGPTLGANEAGELFWGNLSSDISTKDENHLTAYGIMIYDPKSNGASDEVKISVPSDQIRANIIVQGQSSTIATTGGSVQVNSIAGVDLVKLDTEVTDKTSKPMIIVGGPAINPLAAEAMGLTYPAYGAASGIPADKALIKLYENAFGGTNMALVVAGWEAANTRDAANILKDYATYAADLDGKMAVEVSGTSVTAVTETVAVEEEVVEDEVVE
ncbi:hypothetical protein HN777_00160 [Candidatus Woesearchaeota archaeon]|nr:hypothetical protein [Candidatus Woesearchaeota archaeon]